MMIEVKMDPKSKKNEATLVWELEALIAIMTIAVIGMRMIPIIIMPLTTRAFFFNTSLYSSINMLWLFWS